MALKAVTQLCVPTQESITSVLINNKCKVLQLLKEPHYMFVFQVGDIVQVSEDEEIPCDLVVLSCEDPEGTCYITTANLDGETNLKVCLPFYKFRQNFSLNTVVSFRS